MYNRLMCRNEYSAVFTRGRKAENVIVLVYCAAYRTKGVVAVDYDGTRYDMGNKFGILQANIEVGLKHPDTKDELKKLIKKIAKDID